MYTTLAQTCYDLKKEQKGSMNNPMNQTADLGAGPIFRFSPSSNKPFDEKTLSRHTNFIMDTIDDFSIRMESCVTMLERLSLVRELQSLIDKKIHGISQVRVQLLIQLLALCGLLPLNFYIDTPMHKSGGCKGYIDICDKSIDLRGKKLLEWNVREVESLQNTYGLDFTPAMFENLTCIIGRKAKDKKDVFYHLQWPMNSQRNNGKNQVTDVPVFQLVFRYDSSKSSLVAFDGKNLVEFISERKKKNFKQLISWSRNAKGGIDRQKNLHLNDPQNILYGHIKSTPT